MFEDIIEYMNRHTFVTINELVKITGSDKAFIIYAVSYINRNTVHHFSIMGDRVYRQHDKCNGCPFYK